MRGCTRPNFMFSVFFFSYFLTAYKSFIEIRKSHQLVLLVWQYLDWAGGRGLSEGVTFLFYVKNYRLLSMPFRKTETVCLWWLGNVEMPRNDFECKISLHLMEGTLTLGSSAFTLGLWTDVSSWCYDVNLLKLSVTKGTEICNGSSKPLSFGGQRGGKKRLHQALKEGVGVFFVLFLEYLYIYIHVTYAYLDKFILVITIRKQFLERSTKAKVF